MKPILRRIHKLEGARASSQIQYLLLTQILERRHRRLLAEGIPDEPVAVQLRKIIDRQKTMPSLKGGGLAEQILARRRMRLEAQAKGMELENGTQRNRICRVVAKSHKLPGFH